MLDWIPLIFLLQKFQTEENFEKFIYRKCTRDIHKYEYLTGEDILLSNQQQIIEQARFSYSPLGKAFVKQTKTIEDQGKKQIDALKVLEPKAIKSESNKPVITKEFYDKILEERMDEILKMSNKIDFDNLFYNFKGLTS